MTKQLYEEALADVKKLKEVAEDNAKKALIEAVAPRIKDLIEAELLREAEVGLKNPADSDLLLDDEADMQYDVPSDEAETSIGAAARDALGGTMPDVTNAISMPDEEGKVTLDLDALAVEPTGAVDEYMVSNESRRFMEPFAKKINEASMKKFEDQLLDVRQRYKAATSASKNLQRTKTYGKLVSELRSDVENLYKYLQESVGNHTDKPLYENVLEKFYENLNQLTESNMKNRKSLTEAELSFTIKNLPDEVEDVLDDVEIELGSGAGAEDEDEGEEELDLEEPEEGEEEEETPEGEEAAEGDEEAEDLGADLGLGDEAEGEEKKEGKTMESRRLSDNTIVEIDEGMLRREISRMKALREAADDVQDWGHGAGEVSDEFEDEDLGDPFLDVDVTTEGVDEDDNMEGVEEVDEMDEVDQMDEVDEMDEMDELDQTMQGMQKQGAYGEVDEMDEMEEVDQAADKSQYGGAHGDENEQTNKQNRQVESIRRRLAAEKKLQVEAKTKAQMAKKKHAEAAKQSKQNQVEAQKKQAAAKQAAQKKQVKEAQKQKAQAQQKQKEAQKQAKQANQMKEAYVYFATKFNESVQRTSRLQSMLAEARGNGANLNGSSRLAEGSDNLRKKLAETNLFNMKLLYTNKLLQNEALTKRQKADIIEKLDEATTDREVKLVYESLVKTLSGKGKTLSEGANRVLGSSSAPTRAASTVLNEGFEADRWAKLAGIK